MTSSLKVFVDSDVIISSLLSESGAAHLLLFNTPYLKLFISNLSKKELKIVADRLYIDKEKLNNLIEKRCKKVQLKETTEELKSKYSNYTKDPNDTHIVAGAVEAKVKFLISYNIKHFKVDKIKQDFGIIILTPAKFLQYLRSL